jgi:REP element-mobilizing transposase RayT
MPDHMHILVGLRPAQSLSDLIQDIKGSSSKYINDEKFVRSLFRWQEGYGAFSVSKSGVHNVIEYINNQEEHHERVSFNKEFKKLLEELQIGYEEKYLFTELQD